jgi:hypothetical protein
MLSQLNHCLGCVLDLHNNEPDINTAVPRVLLRTNCFHNLIFLLDGRRNIKRISINQLIFLYFFWLQIMRRAGVLNGLKQCFILIAFLFVCFFLVLGKSVGFGPICPKIQPFPDENRGRENKAAEGVPEGNIAFFAGAEGP